jgi:hypothetical protein
VYFTFWLINQEVKYTFQQHPVKHFVLLGNRVCGAFQFVNVDEISRKAKVKRQKAKRKVNGITGFT